MIKIITSSKSIFRGETFEEAQKDYINFYSKRTIKPSKIIAVSGDDEEYSDDDLKMMHEEFCEDIASIKERLSEEQAEEVYEGFKLSAEEALKIANGSEI